MRVVTPPKLGKDAADGELGKTMRPRAGDSAQPPAGHSGQPEAMTFWLGLPAGSNRPSHLEPDGDPGSDFKEPAGTPSAADVEVEGGRCGD